MYPTYAAAKAARKHHRPLFYHQRGMFDPERLKFRSLKKRLYLACVERSIMKRATTLVALTPAEEKNYRAIGVGSPCRVVPNGVEVSAYRVEPAASMKERWGIPDDAKVVLFLGRLHPIKGADRLLEAFLSVHRIFPNAVLVMAGPDEWRIRDSFSTKIEAAGAASRVLFPGMVIGEEKADLLARADLFCLPSDAEGFSIAVLEALASGTAVILSPGCHIPEVEDWNIGWVTSSEPKALSKALESALADPVELRRRGAKAREIVRLRYSWEKVVDLLIEVYQEGIERFRTRGS
jgi:glycosyltransferase involved in cell wall biosynthesis